MDDGTSGGASDLLPELSARLRRLEDERDVLETIYGHSVTIDTEDQAGWLENFTEDGRFAWRPAVGDRTRPVPEGGWTEGTWAIDVRGKAELAEWAAGGFLVRGRENHTVRPPRIVSLEGDEAETETWYVILRSEEAGKIFVRSTGRYVDRLTRGVDGRWRIRERLAFGEMPSAP